MSEGIDISSSLVQDYAIYAASISTIIGGLIVVYKKVVKPVVKHFQNWYDMTDKIDKIFQEFTPNGGTSLKDRVDKTYHELILVGERLKAYLADTPEAHFETDVMGNCTWVNRKYTRLVEREPSEILGHGWHNCVYQPDRKHVVEAWETAVKENRELTLKFRFETPSGKIVSVKGTSYKMTNDKGEVIGYLGKLQILDEPID